MPTSRTSAHPRVARRLNKVKGEPFRGSWGDHWTKGCAANPWWKGSMNLSYVARAAPATSDAPRGDYEAVRPHPKAASLCGELRMRLEVRSATLNHDGDLARSKHHRAQRGGCTPVV